MKKLIKEYYYVPLIIIFILMINKFLFCFSLVSGSSMEPTLSNGNVVGVFLAEKQYSKGDIIIVDKEYSGKPLIKRIVAVPGETIQIINGKVHINGAEIEDYVDCLVEEENYGIAANEVKLNDNEYFVMGDNRNHSDDSRVYGVVAEDNVFGKVIFTLK